MATKYYKAVRVGKGDKLDSLWMRNTKEHPMESMDECGELFYGHTLTYKRGERTSNGRYGIFCCISFDEARVQVASNGYHNKTNAIFRAFPAGAQIPNTSSWGTQGTVLFEGIVLGKKMLWKGTADEA